MQKRKGKVTVHAGEKIFNALGDMDTSSAVNDSDGLVDIRNVCVRTDLDAKERVMDYVRQIKNPYCYLCNGMKVKICFSGTKRMEDCLIEHIF
ncbi:MAG: hypothetical protein LUD16_08750 [Lachnospiraceae bacterium]|nr:hypothetical protein [Lachnospiraceae bacterium]